MIFMIGKVLKYMRNNKNLNQNEIAKLINTKQNTLSRYETETTDINFETIEKIATLCGYSIYFKNDTTGETFTAKDLNRKDI